MSEGDPGPGLGSALRAASDRTGFLPFDRFMEIALYDPDHGYYAQRRTPLGTTGDFYTAPHVTALFSETLAGRIRAIRSRAPDDRPFAVVELGPGDGTLAEGLLRALGDRPEGLEYAYVERAAARAAGTAARLAELASPIPVRRLGSVGAEGPFGGVVIANEYLDAQPARRLRWDGSDWTELGVEIGPTGLVPAERPRARDVPAPALPTPDEPGTVLEVSVTAEAVVREIADHLDAGAAILIDYGAEETELVRGHPQGTLAAVRSHRAVGSPLDTPGTADLSMFVNFSRMRAVARASGLRELAYRSQAEALGEWGFAPRLDAAVRAAGSAEAQVRLRLAAKNLLFGFQNFRVLELAPPSPAPT